MKRTMTTAGLSALAMSAVLVTGCSKESDQTTPVASSSGGAASTAPESGKAASDNGQALVRVISAASGPAVEVSADKNPVFTRVEYKEVTPYKALPANFDDFAVRAAGQDAAAAPLAENSESIMSGRHYTLVIFPDAPAADAPRADGEKAEKKLALDVIADELEPPSAGKARVR